MISAGLVEKWKARLCLMLSREAREMWKNRFLNFFNFFFLISLSGFKVQAQSNSVKIDQPWSKTLFMGRNAADFSALPESQFSTGKDWFLEDCFLLELSNETTFFCFGWTNYCAAIWRRPWVLNRSPRSPTGRKLWSLLSPCTFVPCPDPVSHEHPMNTPAPFFKGAYWKKEQMLRLEPKQGIALGELLKPALLRREEALAKRNIPKCSARRFLPTWCKNTARASAGVTLAVEKPWALAGIRWLVLNTLTREWGLKEQNQCAKQTSHCRLPAQWTWV